MKNNAPPFLCHLLQNDKIEYYTELCGSLEVVKNYLNLSHLNRRLLKCKKCGQLFFHEFLERVDWEKGNDPQYWTWIPVKNESEADILNRGDSLHLNGLFGLFRGWPSDVPSAPEFAELRNKPEGLFCSALDILDEKTETNKPKSSLRLLDYKDGDLWKKLEVKAEKLVKERIKGTRKGLPDEPNYLHSFHVRDSVVRNHHWDDPDYDLFLAALLHDIVEDGDTSLDELRELGFPDLTVRYVDLATHQMEITNKTARWLLMLGKIIKEDDYDVWRIKLADLADNLSQSNGLTPENRHFMLTVKAPIMLRLTEGNSFLQPHRYELKQELEKQMNSPPSTTQKESACT